MAFIPVPNVAEVVMAYTEDGQRLVNTLYFEFPSEPTVSEMTTLAEEIVDWWTANIRPLQTSGVQLVEVIVTDLTFQDAPGIVYTTGLPAAGLVTVPQSMPNSVTLSIKFLTLLRGRNNRGRNYFIGLNENQVIGNTVDSAVRNSIVTAYAELMDIATISFGTWSVVSRYFNNAPRVNGVANEITGVSADNTVDSQRRRLPGRGR